MVVLSRGKGVDEISSEKPSGKCYCIPGYVLGTAQRAGGSPGGGDRVPAFKEIVRTTP